MPKVRLRLEFNNLERPRLLDVSSILYDFELLHDYSILLTAPVNDKYYFTRFFWYRNGRPIGRERQLQAQRITKESPLSVELFANIVFLTAGACWAAVQTIYKIDTWDLNKKKVEAEVAKAQEQLKEMELLNKILREQLKGEKIQNKVEEERLEQLKKRRQAQVIETALVRRLESDQLKLVDFKSDVVEE